MEVKKKKKIKKKINSIKIGIAGGIKYQVDDILFKFSIDHKSLYDGGKKKNKIIIYFLYFLFLFFSINF